MTAALTFIYIMYIKKFGLLICLGMMTMSMGFLSSCGNEEEDDFDDEFDTPLEENGTSVTHTQSEAGNFDGTHLTSVGSDHYFTYFDYLGSQLKMTYSDDEVTFDFSKGIVTMKEGDYEDTARFSTNEKGYLTELFSKGYDEDGYNYTVRWQFQYNNAGHITNAVCSQRIISDTDPDKNESIDITWNLVWNGDLLLSAEINGSDTFDGNWSDNIDFFYTDAVDNRYMQYTSEVIEAIDFDSSVNDFMYVGVFGKGPSKYPSKIVEKSQENADVIDTSWSDLTYTLNSKGLVEREYGKSTSYDGDSYNWEYIYTYDNIKSASAPAMGNKAKVGSKRHMKSRNQISLFGR